MTEKFFKCTKGFRKIGNTRKSIDTCSCSKNSPVGKPKSDLFRLWHESNEDHDEEEKEPSSKLMNHQANQPIRSLRGVIKSAPHLKVSRTRSRFSGKFPNLVD